MKKKIRNIICVSTCVLLIIGCLMVSELLNPRYKVEQTTTKTTSTNIIITESTTTSTTTKKKTTKKVVPKNVVKYHITGYTYEDIKNYLHEMVLAYGWTEQDYNKVLYIMEHESTNPNSNINSQTKPCGLAQAYPCKKVPKQYRQDWKYQIRWMLDYIKNKYKTVDNAYKFKKRTGGY